MLYLQAVYYVKVYHSETYHEKNPFLLWEGGIMKQAVFLIKIGIIVIVVAVVLRVAGYHDAHLIPPINTSPSALHRLADTIFLCAIGIALVEIHRVLQGRSSAGSLPDESVNKEEKE